MNRYKIQIENILYFAQLILISFFFLFFFFPDKFNLQFKSISPVVHDPFYVRIAKVLIWSVVIFNFVYLYYKVFVKRKTNDLVAGICLSVLTFVIICLVFEVGFMFYPQTHGVATTKASALWVDKYYKPINSLNFRDREPDLKTNKKVILFLGDSFTAGYGNNYVKERFSDIFYSYLDSSKYEVYNLGIPGIDTKGEFEKLTNYPLKPDYIILAYFFNDIEVAAAEHGFKIELPPMYSEMPSPFRILVERFYLPNFIYWHLPSKANSILDIFLNKTYKDPTILQTHLNDLSKIVQFKDENHAEMITLMIPFLPDLEYSAKFTKPVSDYLEKNGVTVLNFENEIGKLPIKERIVNKTDSHSSVKVNEIIAKKLFEVFKNQ